MFIEYPISSQENFFVMKKINQFYFVLVSCLASYFSFSLYVGNWADALISFLIGFGMTCIFGIITELIPKIRKIFKLDITSVEYGEKEI